MSATGIVMWRDFRELWQSNAFRIVAVAAAAITAAAAATISIVLARQAWLGEDAARPLLELVMSLVAYFLPFLILMAFVWAFASLPVIREKVNGNIECLLATPMSPAALWMGKCLAIFLPGSILSVVATIVVLLTINLVAINPAIAQFVLPAPAIVAGLFSGPLLLFAVLAFIVLFSLADNPDVAIAPSFIVGFGIMMGLPIGIAADAIDMTSWTFALWHSAGTVVVLTVVFFFSRMLTRQNIVLSSKGS